MTKAVSKKSKRGWVPNPTGVGGFGERPQDGKPGPGRGHLKPLPATGEEPYQDMVRAYTTAESKADSPGVKAARRLLAKDYVKFMVLLTKALPPPQAGGGEATAAAALEVGPQEEAVEELAERLLREWEVEDGGNGTGGPPGGGR